MLLNQVLRTCSGLALTAAVILSASYGVHAQTASEVLSATGIRAGLCVHIGTTDGNLEATLAKDSDLLVEGITTNSDAVAQSRKNIAEQGLFPLANVQYIFNYSPLPYADNLVNVLVADLTTLGNDAPSREEILRVLSYEGKAYLNEGGGWQVVVNSTPDDVDDWRHSVHGPDRYPVSNDTRFGPPLNGLGWIADEYTDDRHLEQYGAGARLASGKIFTMSQDGDRYHLVARDAFSGVLAWQKELDWVPNNGAGYYLHVSNHFTAGDGRIYCYPKAGRYLTAFDSEDGSIIKEYTNTAQLPAGNGDWLFRNSRNATPFREPWALAHSVVLVFDGKILQTYKNEMWLLNEETGAVIHHYSEPAGRYIVQALVGVDGNVYAAVNTGVGESGNMTEGKTEELISLKLSDFSVRWRTALDLTEGGVHGLHGPRHGYLPLSIDGGRDGSNCEDGHRIMMFRSENGEEVWRKCWKSGLRGYVHMLGDRVCLQNARNMEYLDPETGNSLKDINYLSNPGGCSYETFTPQYQLRGPMLCTRDQNETYHINDGIRPDCEIPCYPAYGKYYSFGTGCGCAWFIKAGMSSAYSTQTPVLVDDSNRLQAGSGSTPTLVTTPSLTKSSIVTTDWGLTTDYYRGAKGHGEKYLPQSLLDSLGKAFPLYSTRQTEPVSSNGISVVADCQENRLVATRNGSVKWSFLTGGRVTGQPVIFDDKVIAASHDGWIYAVNLESGSLEWRYLAAPTVRRMVAFGQVESAWPMFGLILYKNSQLVYIAGRRSNFDGGLFTGGINPATGEQLWWRRLADDPVTTDNYNEMIEAVASTSSWGISTNTLNIPPLLLGDQVYALGTKTVNPGLIRHPLQPVDADESQMETGVAYRYYNYNGEVLEALPEFSEITPESAGDLPLPTAELPEEEGTERQDSTDFAALFSGYIKIPAEGNYILYLSSRDGSELRINDMLIVDNDHWHQREVESSELALMPGYYRLLVKFYKGGDRRNLQLLWDTPDSDGKVPVPAEALFYIPGEEVTNVLEGRLSQPLGAYPPQVLSRSGGLEVRFGTNGRYEISLLSAAGRSVVNRTGTGSDRVLLPTSKLASGVYLMRVRTDEFTVTRRFILSASPGMHLGR